MSDVWVPTSSHGPGGTVTSVTAADTSVVVGGTATDPTVRTNTLDVLAADHPPAADWSNNSHKITSLANGAAASDAAAFGQIPTALPPNGAASGSLTGTYPAPSFAPGKTQNTLPESLLANVLAECVPRWALNTNGALLTSARLSSISIPILNGTVCTNLSFCSATTALSLGANRWFALCDSSFNVIRQTTDQLATAWAANTAMTNALDSIPVTAGARVASSTVTLTFPTLSQALTTVIAAGDSVVVSNANIAAYNGTFTVNTVTATQITYTAGSSATDNLAAPFPTVQLAAGKRVFTAAADAIVYAVIMVKATVPTIACFTGLSQFESIGPTVKVSSGDTGLTGTCPSPIAHGTGSSLLPWAAIT